MTGGPGAERRRRIEAVFEAALDVSPEDRPALLERECGGDAGLRDEVDAMLAASDRAAGILEGSALKAASAILSGSRQERIGPYRVLRRIGRGGMAVVYLAERDDGQYRRRVAVKVLPSGAEDVQLYRRFLAERQILASLEHPNIAHLLDGGMTDAGLPYLVLEYVEGQPITEYCDRNRLDIAERLRLFRTVCEAVHYAHQNLVIHRDIKPGNIFVGEDGAVKLLDFGIAKLLNPGLFPLPVPVTRTEHRALTPEYASPEQLRGEPITTASDVYSLGVVLYELLVGRHPYRFTRRSPEEIIRAVCELDPERPSTRVTRPDPPTGGGATGDTSPATIGQARSTTPDRLQRRLRGDLDAVIMVALRKEPGRRYSSAELFSADLGRYLDDLPVTAHRGSRLYRVGKLVRRNRLEAAATVLIAVSLAGGAGLALWQASLAGRERDAAEAARQDTQIALDESRAVSDFLLGLFEASAPGETQGGEVTARELLERGIARVEQLDGSPVAQARMLDVIGTVYERLGEYTLGAATLGRALDIRRATSGPRGVDVAETLSNLSLVEVRRGDYARAIALAEEALDIRRERLGATDTLTARTMAELAGLLIYRGRLDESESLYRDAVRLQEATLGPDHPAVSSTLIKLGLSVHRRGRGEEAEALLRRALDIRQRAYGAEHAAVADVLYSLADIIYQNGGSLDEAAGMYRRGFALERRASGENTMGYVDAASRFADFLSVTGFLDEAEPAFHEAIDLRGRLLGADHPSVSELRAGYAAHLARRNLHADADRIMREALPQMMAGFGPEHAKVAQAELNWAIIRTALGDHSHAAALADDALRIRRQSGGGETTLVGLTLSDIAALRVATGDFAAADSLYRRSLEIVLRSYPPDHFDVRGIHAGMADLYERWGRPELAREHRDAAALPDRISGRGRSASRTRDPG
ncbi:MAG TPA: serine/threonine-protein kinase [Longimicrobiales bacterium]|nr:serine/threonine-protein kinase [Longimicrobiales bacterium]